MLKFFRAFALCFFALFSVQTSFAQENRATESVILSLKGMEAELDAGAAQGVQVGAIYGAFDGPQLVARLRVTSVGPLKSRALLINVVQDLVVLGNVVRVGETVRFLAVATAPVVELPTPPVSSSTSNLEGSTPRIEPSTSRVEGSTPPVLAQKASNDGFEVAGAPRPEIPPRANRGGDYLAALAGLALVLISEASPSSSLEKAFVGDQQFSVISPFPGGGFAIAPNGEIGPGGAMQVNIPVAYAPRRKTAVAGIFAAQLRQGRSLGTADGRNGTFNLGLGGRVLGRSVWVSRMFLSGVSLGGGDRAYNVELQLVGETGALPAIAIGVQDITNAREFSPFVVATKQLGADRPLFVSLGVGRGRFAGSSLFGGLSYAPIQRLTLSTDYDGLQLNLGAGFALTRKISVLASLNGLSEDQNRPAGKLGRRYQIGATLAY